MVECPRLFTCAIWIRRSFDWIASYPPHARHGRHQRDKTVVSPKTDGPVLDMADGESMWLDGAPPSSPVRYIKGKRTGNTVLF